MQIATFDTSSRFHQEAESNDMKTDLVILIFLFQLLSSVSETLTHISSTMFQLF